MKRFLLGNSAYALIGLALFGSGTAAAASVYVGLGDSITFGETDHAASGDVQQSGQV